MNAATIGQFVGFTLACAGVAYLWLGVCWAIRVYKRWPKVCLWSAALLAGLVGVVTAVGNPDSTGMYLVGTVVSVGFVLYRGLRSASGKVAPAPAVR